MGKIKYIRPLIDGGCSECSASEENVGKRRCRHVLETANITVVEELREKIQHSQIKHPLKKFKTT